MNLARVFLTSAILIYVSGWFAISFGIRIEVVSDWGDKLSAQLAIMGAIAALIERTTEVYLNALGLNGEGRFRDRPPRRDGGDAAKDAAIAGLVLGLFVALSGVTVVNQVVTLQSMSGDAQSPHWIVAALFRGTDIVISAGLMAGGATLFHELAHVIGGGLKSLSLHLGPEGRERKGSPSADPSADPSASGTPGAQPPR